MTIIDHFRRQLQYEAEVTQKFIDVVPYDKFDWRPHPKSMTLGRLLGHIVEIPTWFGLTLTTNELDEQKTPYIPFVADNKQMIQEKHREAVEAAIRAFDIKYESVLGEDWTMRNGDQIYFTMSKQDCITQCMSQIPHHRAQLGVYLRLLDIPVPGSYGPSADEMEAMMAEGASS